MKRKIGTSAEENVPTFVANDALIMRLSPRLLLRHQEHLQTQKTAQTFPNSLHLKFNDFRITSVHVLINGANQLKATKK